MKNQTLKILILIAVAIGSIQFGSCAKSSTGESFIRDESVAIIENATRTADVIWDDSCINSLPVEPLSEAEIKALNVMREEELLAKDVYVLLYSIYNVPVFSNISKAETQHALAISSLLQKYNLPDPAINHVAGVFENTALQTLYNSLVAQGTGTMITDISTGRYN